MTIKNQKLMATLIMQFLLRKQQLQFPSGYQAWAMKWESPVLSAYPSWHVIYFSRILQAFSPLNYPNQHMKTSHRIVFDTEDGHMPLYLRGIIYLDRFHFTAYIIYSDGSVWYHNGRKGHLCQKEGPLKSFSSSGEDLNTCRSRNIVLVIYTQK